MIEKILSYQEIDGKLRQIEKELNELESRKLGRQYSAYLKEAEASIIKMENRSREINIALTKLEQSFKEKSKLLDEYAKNVETSRDTDELNYLRKKAEDLYKEIQAIENETGELLKEIATITSQYATFRNRIPKVKAQYNECKKSFEAESEKRRPEVQKLKDILANFKKSIDPDLISKFETLKSQGVYPPFAPLIENRCGGCQMEIPSGILSGIEEKGHIRCDNCHRFVYKK